MTPSTPLQRTFRNMAELFWHRVKETPELEAYRYPHQESWRSLSWKQTGERVEAIARGLLALGLQSEDRVGILSSTRVEWILADLGIMCAGAATTTVYPSTTAEECAYILEDSGTRILFAEDNEQILKINAHRDKLPGLIKIVTFDGASDGDFILGLADLEELGRARAKEQPDEITTVAGAIEPEHLATLIYTSGTTGRPKGVRLVHDCWTYTAEASNALGMLTPDDLQYLWLPLSHSFGKVLLGVQLCVGFPTALDGRIPKLVDNLAVVRPTFMGAAPRIFEKVYNKIVSGAKAGGAVKHAIFKWALGVGKEVSKLRQQGREPTGLLAVKNRVADKLVFSKIRARFGGRLRFFVSGSAPLSRDIAEFFHATGILIMEGYGLTETSAASFTNTPLGYRFGTVGRPLPGCEVRVAPEDGEILIRSPGVMRGYHNLPDETARTLDADNWIHTGDIGELDADGFLRITDRKKDLIKTSGGKYVAPQAVEGRFKAICPLVGQIVVHGDRRNYCSALITLDEESVMAWAQQEGLGSYTYEELTRHDKVRATIQGYVDELNAGLSPHEQLKRFSILPRDLSVDAGDLTPSLKVKRKSVETKYKEVLDSMYEGTLDSL